ncbi:TauD/TfdA dioxygenase family protein [Pseudaestuariivita rosea]|uniref:TauD/TfdA dioxygenase family protein n=1 Tax=Pseudaestuariivita rosea TaxID=2763263 RepID=UPI001ABB55C4|nr:TauD/TfdA family dioxygenase [Pseudaestuariivita rosea]
MTGARDVKQVPFAADAIRDEVVHHGVAVVRNTPISAQDFIAFLRGFGELMFTAGETPVQGSEDSNLVTNVGRTAPPKSVFHSDTTYVSRPPSITGLMAVDVPQKGGATLFRDQYSAYDLLSLEDKSLFEGAEILHGVSGIEPTEGSETECWHPLVRTHLETGRKSLFLTTPARCVALRLCDGEDASDRIADLYEMSIARATSSMNIWSAWDLLFWDKRCTMHAADHSAVIGDRTLYRGMVQGEAPVGARCDV